MAMGSGGGPRYSGDINVGDPSVSESQILQVSKTLYFFVRLLLNLSTMQYVHKMAPHGVYPSGKGSSAVGM